MYENDIPASLAQAAHAGTSFVPEQRGAQMRSEYAATLAQDYANLSKLATTDEKKATLEEEFARYRAGYRRHYTAWLTSRSRCVSTMIAGPSNFPVRRMEKRNAVERRRGDELVEFRERALKAIRKALCPELAPIMSGDSDAVSRLKEKIAKAEAEQEEMKKINRVYDAFVKNPASLDASDLSDKWKTLVRTWKPTYSFDRHPFAPYMLSNNSANIRRMKERLEKIERAKATPESEAQGDAARLEDSPADNRVRLFFPGKPDAGVRENLKRNGFRWTPSLGCWQAYRNHNSLLVAKSAAGIGQHKCARCGKDNQIVNQCGCDPDNLPTKPVEVEADGKQD